MLQNMKSGRYHSSILGAISCLIIFAVFALIVRADPLDKTSMPHISASRQTKKSDAVDKSTILNIRHWSSSDYTRLVIDMDSDAQFKKNLLDDPNRIYFDISNATLIKDLHNKTFSIKDKFIEKVRVAQYKPGTVRVVVDFSEFSACSVFKLQDPSRIVIDVHHRPNEQEKITKSRPVETTAPVKALLAELKVPSNPSAENQMAVEARSSVKEQPEKSNEQNFSSKIVPLGDLIQKDLPDSPTAAEPTSYGERTLTRILGLKIGRIVIDPGHGGHDLGTVGKGGLLEKDLTLSLAFRLKKLLEQKLGAEVILTRDKDIFVSLEERTDIANRNHADLFISIHANSSRHRSISGVETYYLDFAKTESEREVAARENAGAGNSISNLENLVKQIAKADKSAESKELASVIQEKLYLEARTLSSSTQNRGVRRAPFVVLIGANMPSILTEVAFISNPKDEKLLNEEQNRNHLADALFSGIEDYVKKLGSYPIAYQAVPQK
jgi:N-acetylmuramoyl-L-alanine amidase